MFKKIRQLLGYAATSQNATKIDGDNNSVVNITIQGGAPQALALQKTPWNPEPQAGGSVTALLEWRTQLAPLIGRDAELASLTAWLDCEASLSFMVLHADGGSGKTRLAAEFADTCERWQHGWVNLQDFTQAEALVWQGRNLLLVDYAEHQPEQLASLARVAQRAHALSSGKLRVLLVVRHLEPVRDLLHKNSCSGYMAVPLTLGELTPEQDFAIFQAALAKLEKLGQRHAAAVDATRESFNEWQKASPLHRYPLFVTALAIDLARDAVTPSNRATHNWLGGKELLQSLVNRECKRWELAEQGHKAPSGAIETVLVWATLSNGISTAQLNDDLMPAYAWTDKEQLALHQALLAAWPSQNNHISPMAPDLLAAQFLTHWRSSAAAQGHAKRDATLAEKLWNTSDRASFQPKFERLHMLAYDQAMRISSCSLKSPEALQHWLLGLARQLPSFARVITIAYSGRTWSAFGDLVTTLGRDMLNQSNEDLSMGGRAQLLNNQAVGLSRNGDHEGALAAAQEAVDIRRRLAKANPADYEPHLAASLNNLAGIIRGLGNHEGALGPAQESMDIYRRLAEANPAAYEPHLAKSLNNLASFMSGLGNREGALAPAQESVDIRRRLATANPAAYELDLASSLVNLANRISAMDDREGAMRPAQESVDIYRLLAKANPAAYEPDLAASLNNLANRISDMGDHKGALALAQESVNIRRRLAKANPAAYEPGLAMSLGTSMRCCMAAKEIEKANAFGEEALALFTRLSVSQPAVFDGYKKVVQVVLAALLKD